MLAQLADLRLCALMSLRPYVPAPLCPCALMSAPLCPAPLCRVSHYIASRDKYGSIHTINGVQMVIWDRLFHVYKALPLCKPLRFVQFGQESCPAGEYL